MTMRGYFDTEIKTDNYRYIAFADYTYIHARAKHCYQQI
jgi:hypothetical protein